MFQNSDFEYTVKTREYFHWLKNIWIWKTKKGIEKMDEFLVSTQVWLWCYKIKLGIWENKSIEYRSVGQWAFGTEGRRMLLMLGKINL